MKRVAKRPSRSAQQITGKHGGWYYETIGGIEVYRDRTLPPGGVRVRWTRLAASAERCGWKLTRAEPRR